MFFLLTIVGLLGASANAQEVSNSSRFENEATTQESEFPIRFLVNFGGGSFDYNALSMSGDIYALNLGVVYPETFKATLGLSYLSGQIEKSKVSEAGNPQISTEIKLIEVLRRPRISIWTELLARFGKKESGLHLASSHDTYGGGLSLRGQWKGWKGFLKGLYFERQNEKSESYNLGALSEVGGGISYGISRDLSIFANMSRHGLGQSKDGRMTLTREASWITQVFGAVYNLGDGLDFTGSVRFPRGLTVDPEEAEAGLNDIYLQSPKAVSWGFDLGARF